MESIGLCLKSGNVTVFRGAPEWSLTHQAIGKGLSEAAEQHGVPAGAWTIVDRPEKEVAIELIRSGKVLDAIIPRGGAGLRKTVIEGARMPVLCHDGGLTYLYADADTDMPMAQNIAINSKAQSAGAANALDTLLVHQNIAARLLPRVVDYLGPFGVTFRADESAFYYLEVQGSPNARNLPDCVLPARPEDFDTEWLSLVLGLKVVRGLDEAIAHTNAHSMGHSDSILTEDDAHAARWINEVDSAAVYVNASTRFTDGSQFGLGAEVAISTQRLHARGPMGLRELTTYKWVAKGAYQVRE